jgi:aminoglycoside phosphotransferase (APT) family kinase protein
MVGDDTQVPFPPAEGERVDWDALPDATRDAIEARLGTRVVSASSRPGGFSPGLASQLGLADGTVVFLKLVQAAVNPSSIDIHRREARIAAALPPVPECPRLLWSIDAGDWVALAFEFIDASTPQLPWRVADLDRVLAALVELSDALTPSPLAVETAGELFGRVLMQWRDLAEHAEEVARLSPAWRDRLEELVDLERRWPAAAVGDSLLHFDVRADNVLLTDERVHFVDWPWAAVGARWLDLVAMLPSVAMQGGPDPEALWRAHSWSRGVDDDAVDAFIAGFAGMLTRGALQPDPPGLPTLRAFQGAQGVIARSWLARRRGWADAVDG